MSRAYEIERKSKKKVLGFTFNQPYSKPINEKREKRLFDKLDNNIIDIMKHYK